MSESQSRAGGNLRRLHRRSRHRRTQRPVRRQPIPVARSEGHPGRPPGTRRRHVGRHLPVRATAPAASHVHRREHQVDSRPGSLVLGDEGRGARPLRTLPQRDQAAGAGRRVLRLGRSSPHDETDGIVRVTCRSSDGRRRRGRGEATDQGLRLPNHAQRPARDLQRARPVGVSRLLRHACERHARQRRPGLDHRRR